MKLKQALLLTASCLFLAGCNEAELRGTGPVGRTPISSGQHQNAPQNQPPSALPEERLIRRQRRSAEKGRTVSPGDNTTLLANEASGAFPDWLNEAINYDGLYAGHGRNVVDSSNPVLFGDPAYNEYGESKLVIRMWDFALASIGQKLPRQLRVYDERQPWDGIFAHWCMTHALDRDSDRPYASVAGSPAEAASWLGYGDASEPVIGAIMVVEDEKRLHVTFCVGAVLTELHGPNGEMKRLYLGFGGNQAGKVGLAVYSSDKVRAFRLPPGYKAGPALFALEQSPWVDLFHKAAQRLDNMKKTTQIASGGASRSPDKHS